MSATGRSDCRRAEDYYSTPKWCVDALRKNETAYELLVDEDDHLGFLDCLEPACGDGAIVREIDALSWRCVDIADRSNGSLDVCVSDYLNWTPPDSEPHPYDLGITNPPYFLAEQFARKMRRECRVVALLLRLNFLGSKKRATWLRQDCPDVFVLPKRPSFTNNGKSDATEYAWFIWHGKPTGYGVVEVLEL